MKKNILCIFVAALALAAQASRVTKTQARQAAAAWAARNVAYGERTVADGVTAVKSFEDANGVTLWYRVPMSDGGCLIVSPVTELEPVIAALEDVDAVKGIPEDHPMRVMLTRDMTDRLTKLGLYQPAQGSGGATLLGAAPSGEDAAPADPVLAAWAERSKAKWARLLPKGGAQLLAAKEDGVPDPIAQQIGIVDGFEKGGRYTHWNQGDGGGGYCYNYHTPEHAVCGCVATAMAAMMQFFAVTGCVTGATCPRGLIRETQDGIVGATFNGSGAGTYRTLGGIYDWSLLAGKTDRAGYNSLTDTQRELLGRVAYDAAVAVAMAWTKGSSGAYEHDIPSAFRNVFGFKDARFVSNPTEDQYEKLIYHQCWAGAPVGLGIEGHSVLAVGYGKDEDGVQRVRIFTGWGGSCDGWYALPYITTASIVGGSTYTSEVVSCIVTMVGYDTIETVPVVGHMDAPGKSIEVQGTGRTIFSNELGYFGTRVSPGTTVTLACEGKSAEIAVSGDAAVEENKYSANGADLCNALPDAIEFLLLNSSVAYSFAQAKALAITENKAILRVSGTIGADATTNLLACIYALDKTNVNDFTNRFVYFFSPYSPSGSDLPDGNPSFGIFLAEETEQSGRWRYENGRLSYGYGYSNVLRRTTNDYDEASTDEDAYAVYEYVTNAAYRASVGSVELGTFQTNSFPYTTDGMLEALDMVLDGGWVEYERRTAGISLTVTATDEIGAPDPAFGVHANVYRDGQTVTAVAPDVQVTNAEQTVVMTYGGWTLTNKTTGLPATSGVGTTATFTVASNDVLVLTWQMVTNQVWITIKDNDDEGVTEPGSGWYPYGEPVTFVATPASEDDGFSQWAPGENGRLPEYVEPMRGSAVLSFVAIEPLSLIAYYDGASPESAATENFSVRVVSVDTNGNALADAALPSVGVLGLSGNRSVAMGETIELPNVPLGMRVQATVFTNSLGDVWQCVGWGLLPDGAGSSQAPAFGETDLAGFTLTGAAVLEWVWMQTESANARRPLVDPADMPVGANGESAIAVVPKGDGTLTLDVRIGNAVKGYWYAIVTSTTLDGTFTVLKDANGKSVCSKAENDGLLSLDEISVTPNEEKRFFKVRICEEDPDGE